MKNVNTVNAHDQEAIQYDQQVHEYNSYGHDVLFGMSFEYVNPHDCLLDIGIGTGLASQSGIQASCRAFQTKPRTSPCDRGGFRAPSVKQRSMAKGNKWSGRKRPTIQKNSRVSSHIFQLRYTAAR
jgi:hypothetical protein